MTKRLGQWGQRYGRIAAAGLAGFLISNGILAILAASLMHTRLLRADTIPECTITDWLQSPPNDPNYHCVEIQSSPGGKKYHCCPQGLATCGAEETLQSSAGTTPPEDGCAWAGYQGQTPMWCCVTLQLCTCSTVFPPGPPSCYNSVSSCPGGSNQTSCRNASQCGSTCDECYYNTLAGACRCYR